MKCLLRRMLDPNEFLSRLRHSFAEQISQGPSLRSRRATARTKVVSYEPAESQTGMFGGNSNWRGPVWLPINYLLIESLQKFHHYYGDDFKVECPTGSGQFETLERIANELSNRLISLWLRDENGERPFAARLGDSLGNGRDPLFVSRIFSTATPAPDSAPAIKPAGPVWSQN